MHKFLPLMGVLLVTGVVQADVKVNAEHDDDAIVLRSEQGSLPATGIEQLYLQSDVGEVTLTAADTDTITWQLAIVVDDNHNAANQQQRAWAAEAELRTGSEGKQARLQLNWPKGTDLDDNLHERWSVIVPIRLAAKVEMDIGALEINGVAGGVEADLDIGELTIAVPHGDVYANVGIGAITITSATSALGDVDLDVDIGEVQLDGYSDAPQPGYDFPVGQDLHFTAGGADDIQADLNIGEVAVTITTDE